MDGERVSSPLNKKARHGFNAMAGKLTLGGASRNEAIPTI